MNNTSEPKDGGLSEPVKLGEALLRFFKHNGLQFGTADIFCLGRGGIVRDLQDLVTLLNGFRDASGQSLIEQLTIIIPGSAALRVGGADEIRSTLAALPLIREWTSGRESVPEDRLRVIVPADLRSETLLSSVEQALPRSVIIVVEAALFRFDDVEPYEASPHLPEDFWAPQLHALADRIVKAVKNDGPYLILIAGQALPYRPELQALLQSIGPVGVLGGDSTDTIENIIAEKKC
jgi:hypothetical protein